MLTEDRMMTQTTAQPILKTEGMIASGLLLRALLPLPGLGGSLRLRCL